MNAHTSFPRAASLLLLTLLIAAAPAEPTAAADAGGWVNALKPAGTAAAPLVIFADGTPRYAILLPAKPTGPERKAAAELQQWLKALTGTALTIATEDHKPDGFARFISVGNTELLKTSGHAGDGNDLADEGYAIAVAGEHVLLRGGSTRGIVNAVYALLEEDLGLRWYTRGGDVTLPPGGASKTLTLAVVPRSYVPRLKLRDPYYAAAFDADWSLRNRTNAPGAAVPEESGGRVDYGGLFVHTHADLLPAATYFKDHPEYFAQNAAGQRYPAQLCPTNPDVARIVTQNVLKALEKSPNAEIVSISKNDNSGDQICMCPTCTKLRQAEGGSDAANQLFLVNKVAQAVEQKYPRVIVDTLAYLETSGVPKTVRPRRNVAIRRGGSSCVRSSVILTAR